MAHFRKRPVVIEAIQWKGVLRDLAPLRPKGHLMVARDKTLKIGTLEGIMTAKLGDWIVKGVAGEFYPCKPDIFEQTYEPA